MAGEEKGIWIVSSYGHSSKNRNDAMIRIEKYKTQTINYRITFNYAASRQYTIKPDERVHIYIEKKGISIFIVTNWSSGLRLCKVKKKNQNGTTYRYRIYTKRLYSACRKLGIKLPVVASVTFDKTQRCWVGTWINRPSGPKIRKRKSKKWANSKEQIDVSSKIYQGGEQDG